MPTYDTWQDALEAHDYDFEAASEAYDGGSSGGDSNDLRVARAEGPEFSSPGPVTETRQAGTYTGTRQELPDDTERRSPAGEETPHMTPQAGDDNPGEGEA